MYQVAILAGGKGTRLSSRSGELPKPMVPVLGKPVLHHQVELCRQHGFTKILMLVHHRHDVISDYFGDGRHFGVDIRYEVEHTPRGTAGALRDSLGLLAPEFLLLYGDTYLDVDLGEFFRAHQASEAAGTLFLHPNDHPEDSDLVDVGRDGYVRGVYPYPHPEGLNARNLVNAALYVFRNERLHEVAPETGQSDIAKHMLPAMLSKGAKLKAYVSPEYIKDMGTPDRLDKVERDIEKGLPQRLSTRQLRTAVFLDRDGTLNREMNHLRSADQVELLPHVGEAVHLLNRSGMLAVVVTNQPVVARGDVTADGLDQIHGRLDTLLGAERAYLDGLYYCPHHPHKGFEGEVPELKMVCDCRKPRTGLIDQATREFSISRPNSWMIGDSTSDIEAGYRAGVKTILLRSGNAGRDQKYPTNPEYTATNLLEAVQWIIQGHMKAKKLLASIAISLLDDYRLVVIGGLAQSGKSSAAQVLKELLASYGKTAHVVSLDGWKKPTSESRGDAEAEYDLERATQALTDLVTAKRRMEFLAPVRDRANGKTASHPALYSIGADDIIIVEGTPALQMTSLAESSKALKLYIETSEDTRAQRLRDDYGWRGSERQEIDRILTLEANEEQSTIRRSAKNADFTITLG